MNADIIVCWPRNCDYPAWRNFIHANRSKFNLVIIVFTETNFGEDYRQFVRDAMRSDYVLFIDNIMIRGDEDWRDVAIHQALLHSYNAQWIWFTEQDFLIKPGFWEFLDKAVSEDNEVIATYDKDRMHPCNIFIRRDTLMSKTRKRFGIVKDISDHFSLFQKELEGSGARIAKFPEETYEHLNGLSHNMTLVYRGELPNWQVEAFDDYLQKCMHAHVPLDAKWWELFNNYLEQKAKVSIKEA